MYIISILYIINVYILYDIYYITGIPQGPSQEGRLGYRRRTERRRRTAAVWSPVPSGLELSAGGG